MIQHSSNQTEPFSPHGHVLCPQCNSQRVIISATVRVEYEVARQADNGDVKVVADMLEDCGWNTDSQVHCKQCSWNGTVADLQLSGE